MSSVVNVWTGHEPGVAHACRHWQSLYLGILVPSGVLGVGLGMVIPPPPPPCFSIASGNLMNAEKGFRYRLKLYNRVTPMLLFCCSTQSLVKLVQGNII